MIDKQNKVIDELLFILYAIESSSFFQAYAVLSGLDFNGFKAKIMDNSEESFCHIPKLNLDKNLQ